MSVDAIAEIDALIENHMREVRRLETARDVLAEILGKPKDKKTAPMFTVRRAAPAEATATAEKPKKSKQSKKKQSNAGKLGKLGDFAIKALLLLQDNPGATSDDLARLLDFGETTEDRKRLYNSLYTLKLRGDVTKNGMKFSLSNQGLTTLAEAKMLETMEERIETPPPQPDLSRSESVAA